MDALTKFLRLNNLKQKELAAYLGVTEATVSKMLKGNLSGRKYLGKIIDNPYGWDVSMLNETARNTKITAKATNNSSATVSIGQTNMSVLENENRLLRKQLEEEKARSAQYWQMIQTLMQKQ